MKVLVVVESPNKIKKIQSYLNRLEDGNAYLVSASVGHLLDLNKEDGALGIDIEKDIEPDYVRIKTKTKVITDLKHAAKQCDQIWIASDLDHEGEFIGYSICNVLSLPAFHTKRLIFNEITESAITAAVKNPTVLKQEVLNAQKCRRILDRLIGFQLSQAGRRVNPHIAVGRVKTVMVRLVADRERERDAFVSETYYRLTGEFSADQTTTIAARCTDTLADADAVEAYLINGDKLPFVVSQVSDTVVKQSPPPPFKTGTLQREGSRRFSIPPKTVLELAQKLYEMGLISYPRTDTTVLPVEKATEIRQLITAQFGADYLATQATTAVRKAPVVKGLAVQGAHAAIYPTDLKVLVVQDDGAANGGLLTKVYHMIYVRAVASEMAQARYRQVELDFADEMSWTARFKSLVFEGFIAAKRIFHDDAAQDAACRTSERADDADESDDCAGTGEAAIDSSIMDKIMRLKRNDVLTANAIIATEEWTKPPSRYDSAGILDQLEKHGIGRPSTWGSILDDVLSRGFIAKTQNERKPQTRKRTTITYTASTDGGGEVSSVVEKHQQPLVKNRIELTDLGKASVAFATEHFDHIFNYKFTSDLEKRLNAIETGTENWVQVVRDVYQSYVPKMTQLLSDRSLTRTNKRVLGTHEDEQVVAYLGRYGPVIQVGDDRHYPIKGDLSVDTITLDDAVRIMSSENVVLGTIPTPKRKAKASAATAQHPTGDVVLKRSKYGYYVRCGEQNFRLCPEHFEPHLTNMDAVAEHLNELVFERVAADITTAKKNVVVGPYAIVNGKYGPYFRAGTRNISVPKQYHHQLEAITAEMCKQWTDERSERAATNKRPVAAAAAKRAKAR